MSVRVAFYKKIIASLAAVIVALTVGIIVNVSRSASTPAAPTTVQQFISSSLPVTNRDDLSVGFADYIAKKRGPVSKSDFFNTWWILHDDPLWEGEMGIQGFVLLDSVAHDSGIKAESTPGSILEFSPDKHSLRINRNGKIYKYFNIRYADPIANSNFYSAHWTPDLVCENQAGITLQITLMERYVKY